MNLSENTKEQIEFVRRQLISCEIQRESLPYHKKFGELYAQYSQSNLPALSKNNYWKLLLATGKKGNSKQQNKIKRQPIFITEKEESELLRLITGSIEEKNLLPYTTNFDYFYKTFKQNTQKNLTKNDFWRLLLQIEKTNNKSQQDNFDSLYDLPQILLANLYEMNLWWKEYVPDSTIPQNKRYAYQDIFDKLLNGRCPIVVLRGPRQVGKSTIQQQIIYELLEKKYIASPKQILHIQFDNLKSFKIDDPLIAIINWYEHNIVQDAFNKLANKGQEIYIFLDEIQEIDNWNSQIKHIVDIRRCHVFITGSSAIRIFDGKESLAGRAYWNEITTLGLSEICQFRNMGNLSAYTSNVYIDDLRKKEFWVNFKNWSVNEQLLDKVYKKYCDFGGYPFCHINESVTLEEANEYLSEIVVARTIDHEIKAQFDAEYKDKNITLEPALLRKTFRTLCKYTGILIGINKLRAEIYADTSESLTDNQIQLILDLFENSMLIKVIKSFGHRIKRAKREKKFCLCDHAIRKALLREDIDLYGKGINSDIAGHIIEGIVGTFLTSLGDVGVSYLPNGNDRTNEGCEIDFILEIGSANIPIEVKYREHPDVNSGIESFLKNPANNAPFGLVITKNEVPINYFKNENIIPISVKKLLLLK
ncbi:MAG: ATP-binding protein [Planctomycetaceae bacterium]|jgi:predicted AAA+ superfamily ATPase|nr:ATP-binding protein [Planctomycetaceae bacterium]